MLTAWLRLGILLLLLAIAIGAILYWKEVGGLGSPALNSDEIVVDRAMLSPLRDVKERHAASIDFPAVAAILKARTPATEDSPAVDFNVTCTGTLVSRDVVLTAAHCFCMQGEIELHTLQMCRHGDVENRRPANYKVYFQHAGLFDLKDEGGIEIYPDYNGLSGDVAVLRLARAVTGIAPARIGASTARFGVIVGFGRHLQPAETTAIKDAAKGIKYHAFSQLTPCPTGTAAPDAALCSKWHVIEDVFGRPQQQNLGTICKSDSGGPLLTFVRGGIGHLLLIGVASRGLRADEFCRYGQTSAHVSLVDQKVRNWVMSVAGADQTRIISGGGKILDGVFNRDAVFLSNVARGTKEFAADRQTLDEVIVVKAGMKALRVSVNGTYAAVPLEISLLRTDGSAEVPEPCDTSPSRVASFVACRIIEAPRPGRWRVQVKGSKGQQIQIVAIAL